MDQQARLVVVGGGISGLAAAYYLTQWAQSAQRAVQITLIEREARWGGKIITDRVDDFVIEGGPDTFLATKPWAVALCRQLGIADRLQGTNPAQKNTYILHQDQLHPLPGGLTMMIPTEFASLLRTGLLSWPGKFRMGLDYLIPSKKENGDETIGQFISRRLGSEAYHHMIEPLMSGIYAGDGEKLSLQATLPYLRDLEEKHGGLVRGAISARNQRAKNGCKPTGSRSLFLTPLTGLAELVEALVKVLDAQGVELLSGVGVEAITQDKDSFLVALEGRKPLRTDGLILATPAFVSGKLVEAVAPTLARELLAIEYTSTATISLAYRKEDVPRPLDGYGYVIPRREGRKALACTWTSTKFPHRAPDGYVLVRVFVGRAGQEGEIPWDDEGLLDIAREEVDHTLQITAEPIVERVFRWEQAMPQYNLGHPARLKRIDALLEGLPGLALAGNGYRGIGIPDCIHSGEVAAEKVLAPITEKHQNPIKES